MLFRSSWFKLAPYYNSLSHLYDSMKGETVRVGQYYEGIRWSQSQQEMFAFTLIKGTFADSTTIFDNMMILGENIAYQETKGFFEGVTIGTPLSTLTPFVKNVIYTADQTQELFYNKPGNPYGRHWYQLAPVPTYYQTLYAKRTSGNQIGRAHV